MEVALNRWVMGWLDVNLTKEGRWRMSIDFSDIHKTRSKYRLSARKTLDKNDCSSGALCFTNIGMRSGYCQVRSRVDDDKEIVHIAKKV